MKSVIVFACCILVFGVACKKSSSKNPYSSWTDDPSNPANVNKPIDPNTIQGLHKNIFKPTCSNSGCHDGNFEPDFRTVESSYNSLINRLSTNTDPNNPQFNLRVVPGDAAKSMLLHRINNFIPGSQGIMPLSVDPGSDWPAKKAEYIQNIVNWINDGAKDQFGNLPSSVDFTPQMGGLIAFADGASTPLPRSLFAPIQIPSGTNTLKLMMAYIDDKTPINQFTVNSVNFSLTPYQYDSTVQTMTIEPSAFNSKGVQNTTIDYWHSITVNVADLGLPGDVIWIRTEVADKVNPVVFVPASTSSFNMVKHFAIKIN